VTAPNSAIAYAPHGDPNGPRVQGRDLLCENGPFVGGFAAIKGSRTRLLEKHRMLRKEGNAGEHEEHKVIFHPTIVNLGLPT